MDQLKHYGVPGMRWGIRKERELLGRKRRFHNTDSTSKRKGLSDRQKRILKIGAALAVAGLATYGLYKLNQSGKLDDIINRGKMKTESLLKKKPIDSKKPPLLDNKGASDIKNSKSFVMVNGIKKMAVKEPLSDTLKRVNPNLRNPKYKNNCTLCSITGFLRQQGYDVSAGGTGGKQQNLAGVVDECFKGAKIFDGSAVKFAKSKTDAAEMLVKKFGYNAEGVVSVQWKRGGGHAFNWVIKNGVVTFFDGQSGYDNNNVHLNNYWKSINPNDALTIARLDNAKIDFDGVKKFLETNQRHMAA